MQVTNQTLQRSYIRAESSIEAVINFEIGFEEDFKDENEISSEINACTEELQQTIKIEDRKNQRRETFY